MLEELSQFWTRIQGTLFPFLRENLGPLSETQQKLAMVLELTRIEKFVNGSIGRSVGRVPKDRRALARAFVAKAVYNMPTTKDLIDRLHGDTNLRRICGFELRSDIPDESTFSRAFGEFAQTGLAAKVHEALIIKYRSEPMVGHISIDSTAIEAREKPIRKEPPKKEAAPKRRRGRPKKGEHVEPKEPTVLEKQQTMSLKEILAELPVACDRGTKKNSKGYSESWNGYKLHIDTGDGEIPISCILTSASTHDSQVAIPLMIMSGERVTNLYDLMDAAYDAEAIKTFSTKMGHVPIIDHNPRRGEKIEMEPAKAERYKARTASERVNARLKDEFGGRVVRVRGATKVMSHLMFGVLAITADQLMRLVI
jgi:IS5 family transposase